jgi:hypothetical protein
MRDFTDANGQCWSIVVTVDTIRRVRQLASVDLMQAVGGKLLEQIAADPVLLVDVLAAACKPQMDARAITAADFGAAMHGDAIDHASQALMQGLADFFPSPTRTLLQRLIDASWAHQAKTQELTSAALDRVIAQMQAPGSGASSPSLPPSPDATQAH